MAASFDSLDRPTTFSEVGAGVLASYGYRGPFLVQGKTLGNGISGSTTFDASRRPLQHAFTAGDGLRVFEESLSWSPRSLKTAISRADSNGVGLSLGYDGAGRVTQVAKEPSPLAGAPNNSVPDPLVLVGQPESFQFSYDAAQNLVSRAEVRDGVPEVWDLPNDASGRNRPGSINGSPLIWDANGNLVSKGDLDFEYDYRNRLTRVTDAAASEVASYAYDAFNRRVAKTVGATTTETVWDDWRAIEDYENGVLTSRRTYGIGLDEMIRMENDLNGDGLPEQSYVPLYDSTGNLVVMTGPDGTPVERYQYTPYGERTILVDSTPPEIEQVRVTGGEIWVEVSEEVLESELTAAVNLDLLRLVRTDTSQILPISVSQPVQQGGQARRRLVISPTTAPATGTQVRLTFEPDSLVDLFVNKPPLAVEFTFAWPAADVIVSDTVAPRVELVVVRGGVLEIELSEEVDPALAAAEILVGGTTRTWTLQPDRYTLASDTSLAAGSYELRITTGGLDLVGLGLQSEVVGAITVDSAIPETLVFRLSESRLIEESALQNAFGFHGLSLDAETRFIYVRNRYYAPELNRYVSSDPLGFVDGPSQYLFAFNSPLNAGDSLGLAGYFFDGTDNDREKMANDTNVAKLFDVYAGVARYREGVGSEGWTKFTLGGPSGAGGRGRLEWMYWQLVRIYNSGIVGSEEREIDIFGFSRGAALAREFANMIYRRGIPDLSSARTVTRMAKNGSEFGHTVYDRYFERPTIRFLGLFDTVASFGEPGNDINLGYDLSIPPNVLRVRHATAMDERRALFPLSSVKERAGEPNSARITEREFPGVHSDVGGGYQDNDLLSRIPLQWMWQEARAAGVPLVPVAPAVGGIGGSDPLISHDSQPLWDWLIGARRGQFGREIYYYPRRR